jgi:hypothetical protein
VESQFTASVVIETFLVLLTGTLAIVFLIAALATRVRSATWRRTLWQVSTLTMLLLVVGETLGLGVAVANSVHAMFSRARNLRGQESKGSGLFDSAVGLRAACCMPDKTI